MAQVLLKWAVEFAVELLPSDPPDSTCLQCKVKKNIYGGQIKSDSSLMGVVRMYQQTYTSTAHVFKVSSSILMLSNYVLYGNQLRDRPM